MERDDDSTQAELGYKTGPTKPQNATGRTNSGPGDSQPGRSFCDVCEHVIKPHYTRCPLCEGRKNRAKVESLAVVIREVKSWVDTPASPESERRAIKQLYELGHPDVDGLLGWARASSEAQQGYRQRR